MEKERLKYCIDRFDHYFESVNNKTTVYITINTFITGGAIALIEKISSLEAVNPWCVKILGVILFLGLLSLILLAWNSIPFFSKRSDSLYFFGAIGNISQDEFNHISKNQKEKKDLKDLRQQVYVLSLGLTKKFIKLQWVGRILLLQFVLLIPFEYLIIFKN